MKHVEIFTAEEKSFWNIKLDPAGFFVIHIDRENEEIIVEYYSNVTDISGHITSGKINRIYKGKTAESLGHLIAKHHPELQVDHAIYLGRELQKAEFSLKNNTMYEQS